MAAALSKKLVSVQNPKSLIGTWVFTVFWCGISFTLFWVFAVQARDIVGGIVGGLFSLIGLGLLFLSLKLTLEYLKYGQVHLTLEGVPPAVGQGFNAKLDLPMEAAQAGKVSAELACVEVTWARGSKGGPSRVERDAWTAKHEFPVRRGAVAGYATLRFDVPADRPATDVPGDDAPGAMFEVGFPAGVEIGRTYFRWEVRVKADVPGVDLDRTFKLPVSPAKRAAGTRPAVAPAAALRIDPAAGAELEQRAATRREAQNRLSALCAFVAFAPFLAAFGIAGLAIGLAGCPMSFSSSAPPHCEFAGIDWGPLMSRAFDLMFVAVPAGMAGAVVLFVAGQAWLSRRELADRAAGPGRFAGVAVGLVAAGFFIYAAWDFARPIKTAEPVAPPTQQPAQAREDASNIGRGYHAQYVKVTGQGIAGEAHGTDLRVRIGEIRLESTGKLPATRYTGLGISVYQRGKTLGATWNHDVGGELTPLAPSATLTGQAFVVPWAGSQCVEGGCEVRLLLRVETAPNAAHAENTDFAVLPVTVTVAKAIAQPAPAQRAPGQPAPPRTAAPQTMEGWEYRVLLATTAISQQRYDDAGRLLKEALAFVEKAQGVGRPGSARVRYQMHILYERQKNPAQQEQALLDALAILEKYPDAEVQNAIGTQGGALDKEIVARRLGDFYWDQRRYDRAYVYYDRAYRYVAHIALSDAERNLRLARNSAGRMAGACTQGNWDVADSAMKELKERMAGVDAETRRQLDYWVRTGEPRLAARKC